MTSQQSYLPRLALQLKLDRARAKSRSWEKFVTDYPDQFIDQFVLDDMTGQPLELIDTQHSVLRAMFKRDEYGDLIYDTILYSAPKKSGKTSIGGSVALWQAWRVPGDLYIIGNDLKQADNRMAQFIRYTLQNNPAFNGHYKIKNYTVHLSNGSTIHAIPVDPEGEAGMNPTGLFWTEAWGAKHAKHELLWSEAALSPQRIGQSFKFIESYAGYKNTSMILWRLYESIFVNGQPHPADPELRTKDNAIAWWCTRPILPEQKGDQGRRYYATQSATLLPAEYSRQHRNEWADALQQFMAIEAWDNCKQPIPPLDRYEQMVMAIDASVSGDCTAAVVVSRRGELSYVRSVKIWEPTNGERINYEAVENWILSFCKDHPVACVVYDPYQMEYMSDRLRKAGIWIKPFNQGAPRLRADKSLHDRIINRQIAHDGNPVLRQHVMNANAQIDKEDGKLRITKSNEMSKVDALVALSMACSVAGDLNIG